MRGYPFAPISLFPSIKLEQIWEIEFHLAKFFHTSPSSFDEYEFKGFIWQYDKMIEYENKQNQDPNRVEMTNPFLPR